MSDVAVPRGGRTASSNRRRGWGLKRIALISVAVLLFLAISAMLARFLSVENVERDDDLALIQAQARGDVAGVLAQLAGCRQRPACAATVAENARNPRLLRAGAVKILSLKSSTAYSLTGATGKTRVAFLKRLHERYPRNFWITLRLGMLLLEVGRPAEAVGDYQTALATRPGMALAHNNHRSALTRTNRSGEAIGSD